MAGERRIVTKVAYDTTEVVKGAQAGRAALSSFADTSKASTSSLEREYKRLLGTISPTEKAQLAFARAVASTNELVKKGRLTQEQANTTLREAEAHYKRAARAADDLGDANRRQSLGVDLLRKAWTKLGPLILGAFTVSKAADLGRRAVEEAVDAAAAHALLENRVRATGGAAGFTAGQLDKMADSLSAQLAIDDEVISGVEEMALKYQRISGDEFPRFIRLALDAASEQGKLITSTDQVSGSVEKFGKILNEPALAEARLRREGKGLSEEQAKLLQGFLKTNDIAAAQGVIFEHLERQYGGNAKALRDEVGGSIAAVEVAWGNLLEEFGKGLTMDTSAADEFAKTLTDPELLQAVRDIGSTFGEMLKVLGQIVGSPFFRLLMQAQENTLRLLMAMGRISPAGLLLHGLPKDNGGWQTGTGNFGSSRSVPGLPGNVGGGGDGAAKSAAAAAQKQAEKLRETYAGILEEHERIRQKQVELLALYSREGLTAKARKEGEQQINDRYADRVTHAKTLKQFEDLGPARALEMAENLVRVTAEERERGRTIEAQIRLAEERWKREAEFGQRSAEMIREAMVLSAARAEAAWEKALDAIEEGTKPIRDAMKELAQLDTALDFERRSAAISAPTAQLEAIERDYLAFLARVGEGSVAAGEEAVAKLAETIGVSVDEIKAKWGELADLQAISGIRGAGATPAERYRAEVAELERLRQVAADKGLDMERDFEARRLQLSTDFWDAQLSAWSGALDFLAGAFGGIFADLQRVANSYQAGRQAGAAIGDAIGIGAAAGGVAGGIVGIWVAAWQWFESQGAKRRAESYGSAAVVSMTGGAWNEHFTQLEAAQRRASDQIEATIEEFARVIGGTFSTFADLEVQVRRDGQYFRAFVEGVFVGSFKDMQSATEAAILAAFRNSETTLRGVSDLVRQGFQEAVERGVNGLSLSELQGFLGDLREISELTWDNGARQLQESIRHFDDLWDSLTRLGAASEAARQGAEDLIAAEADAFRSRIRSLTGQQESPEEQLARLRREGELMEAQLRMRIADLHLREVEIKTQMELLRARGTLVGAGATLAGREIDAGFGYTKARAKLVETEVSLYQAQLDAMAASLAAIGKLIEELERLDAEFDPGDIKLPRTGGGGGGGGIPGQSLADLIAESRRAIAAADQSAYRQQLEDIKRRWAEAIRAAQIPENALERARRARDEAIKAANGNADAIRRANEQYERATRNIARTREELDAANRQRDLEIALLQRQQREAADRAQRDYVGGANPFRAERDRAAELKAQWKELLDTGAIKWREYKRRVDEMNEALENHIRTIGLQEQAGLFGGLAALLDMAGLEESEDKARLLYELNQVNFTLQLAEARLRYTQLVAEGVLIGKNKELVERVLGELEGFVFPDFNFNPPPAADTRRFLGYDDASSGGSSASSALDEANRLRERYASALEDPFRRRLREITEDFQQMFTVLGRGPEMMDLFTRTVDAAFDELREPVQSWLDSLNFGDQAALTSQQRYEAELAQMAALEARILAGDMTAYQQLGTEGNELLAAAAAALGTAGTDYQSLLERLRAFAAQSLTVIDATAANFVATGNPTPGNLLAMPLQPLGSGQVVDAIVAGNASTRASLAVLTDIRRISEGQGTAINNMARDIQQLRTENASLARELEMLRHSRAS